MEKQFQYFESLWNGVLKEYSNADTPNRLYGKQAAVYLSSISKLDKSILRDIWAHSDFNKQGYLDLYGFIVAMTLVQRASANPAAWPPAPQEIQSIYAMISSYFTAKHMQQNTMQYSQPLHPQVPPQQYYAQPVPLQQQVPAAIPAVTQQQQITTKASSSQAQQPSEAAGSWDIPSDTFEKYMNVFKTQSDETGHVAGTKADELFAKAKLSDAVLNKIWNLVKARDTRTNMIILDKGKFAVAFHLTVLIGKKGYPVPEALPDALSKYLPQQQQSQQMQQQQLGESSDPDWGALDALTPEPENPKIEQNGLLLSSMSTTPPIDQNDPSKPQGPKFKKGFMVEHTRKSDGLKRIGKVVGVHLDDIVRGIYYTVEFPGGHEIQTDEINLIVHIPHQQQGHQNPVNNPPSMYQPSPVQFSTPSIPDMAASITPPLQQFPMNTPQPYVQPVAQIATEAPAEEESGEWGTYHTSEQPVVTSSETPKEVKVVEEDKKDKDDDFDAEFEDVGWEEFSAAKPISPKQKDASALTANLSQLYSEQKIDAKPLDDLNNIPYEEPKVIEPVSEIPESLIPPQTSAANPEEEEWADFNGAEKEDWSDFKEHDQVTASEPPPTVPQSLPPKPLDPISEIGSHLPANVQEEYNQLMKKFQGNRNSIEVAKYIQSNYKKVYSSHGILKRWASISKEITEELKFALAIVSKIRSTQSSSELERLLKTASFEKYVKELSYLLVVGKMIEFAVTVSLFASQDQTLLSMLKELHETSNNFIKEYQVKDIDYLGVIYNLIDSAVAIDPEMLTGKCCSLSLFPLELVSNLSKAIDIPLVTINFAGSEYINICINVHMNLIGTPP